MAEHFELHLERDLAVPYDSALRVLQAGPEQWLPGFGRDGERITAQLAFDQAGRRISRRVEVLLGRVQRFAYGVTVRIEWTGARRPHLYPRLEGHLRLEGDERGTSHLRLDARYVPPAGRFGASVDRALLNRVPDVTVNDFIERVAGLLAGPGPAAPLGSEDPA